MHYAIPTLSTPDIYSLLTGGVVPRPIAWVSTRSSQGVDNLAPFSFFTVVSVQPPVLAVVQVNPSNRPAKDTLANLRATKECVVNVVTQDLLDAMNATATEYPPEISEFDAAAIARSTSQWVAPPGVQDAQVRYECRLRDVLVVSGCTGADLPMEYQIQMEQQCAVSDCDKILFMASAWDSEDRLIEELHCWYTPNLELRARILAGWEQFHKDVAAYVPPEPKPATVVAEPMESLPAVSVRLDGKLAVVSNLPDFATALRAFIERIPAKPDTDQDFANAEAACKSLKRAEDALTAGEDAALGKAVEVLIQPCQSFSQGICNIIWE